MIRISGMDSGRRAVGTSGNDFGRTTRSGMKEFDPVEAKSEFESMMVRIMMQETGKSEEECRLARKAWFDEIKQLGIQRYVVEG